MGIPGSSASRFPTLSTCLLLTWLFVSPLPALSTCLFSTGLLVSPRSSNHSGSSAAKGFSSSKEPSSSSHESDASAAGGWRQVGTRRRAGRTRGRTGRKSRGLGLRTIPVAIGHRGRILDDFRALHVILHRFGHDADRPLRASALPRTMMILSVAQRLRRSASSLGKTVTSTAPCRSSRRTKAMLSPFLVVMIRASATMPAMTTPCLPPLR